MDIDRSGMHFLMAVCMYVVSNLRGPEKLVMVDLKVTKKFQVP